MSNDTLLSRLPYILALPCPFFLRFLFGIPVNGLMNTSNAFGGIFFALSK